MSDSDVLSVYTYIQMWCRQLSVYTYIPTCHVSQRPNRIWHFFSEYTVHTAGKGAPFIFLSTFVMTMYIVKRDGRLQCCQFDKIQNRIAKLSYGLDKRVRLMPADLV